LIEQGVAVGERLVLEGTDRLRDGSLVEVIGEGQVPATVRTDVQTQQDV